MPATRARKTNPVAGPKPPVMEQEDAGSVEALPDSRQEAKRVIRSTKTSAAAEPEVVEVTPTTKKAAAAKISPPASVASNTQHAKGTAISPEAVKPKPQLARTSAPSTGVIAASAKASGAKKRYSRALTFEELSSDSSSSEDSDSGDSETDMSDLSEASSSSESEEEESLESEVEEVAPMKLSKEYAPKATKAKDSGAVQEKSKRTKLMDSYRYESDAKASRANAGSGSGSLHKRAAGGDEKAAIMPAAKVSTVKVDAKATGKADKTRPGLGSSGNSALVNVYVYVGFSGGRGGGHKFWHPFTGDYHILAMNGNTYEKGSFYYLKVEVDRIVAAQRIAPIQQYEVPLLPPAAFVYDEHNQVREVAGLGYVLHRGEKKTFMAKTGGNTLYMREYSMMFRKDENVISSVPVSMWGEELANKEIPIHTCVLVLNARTDHYQERPRLAVGDNGTVVIDVRTPQAMALQTTLERNRDTAVELPEGLQAL